MRRFALKEDKPPNQEDAEAFAQLAYSYQRGRGYYRNLKLAEEWYFRAAQAGSSKAFLALALLYDPRRIVGLPQDFFAKYFYKAATAAFRYDADYGNIDACYWLGIVYLLEDPEDRDAWSKAALWMQKAADFGHQAAKFALKVLDEKAGDCPLPPRPRFM